MAKSKADVLKNSVTSPKFTAGKVAVLPEASDIDPEGNSAEDEVISLQPKFVEGVKAMSAAMVERETEVKLLVTSALIGEHCLFVGPPGLGKSHITDNFRLWLQIPQDEYFEYLFSKFTDPSEIFGPQDIDAMVSRGEVRRITEGFLPHAKLAFIDEYFKASPAIINCLLKIMNERIFKFGRQMFKADLRCLLASSNEFGQDQQELAASFDRFLIRDLIQDLSEEGDKQLYKWAYDNYDCRPKFTSHVSFDDIDQAQQEFINMPMTTAAKQSLWDIMDQLKQDGIQPSPRRKVKMFKAFRAWAWLEGKKEVESEDLEMLAYILWVHPDQRGKVKEVVEKHATPLKVELNSMLLEARDAVKKMGDLNALVKALREIESRLSTRKDIPFKKKVSGYVSDQINETLKKISMASRT